ncbi:ATPase [Ralstonia nicotianae]|uniref:ATPase n=1 Tax=Ralstonia pseudosolanacearum TaxID=1310165 RepID=UPI0020048812|nr:ATPase [Ralstonia pseudosolanacearum]MCK4118397.1 ATPase [Ralstonia pseudosolanacearum]
MILDIHGKKFAFGMTWRSLVGSEAPDTLAARIARDERAERIWHDDQALHMGFLAEPDRQVKVKDKLYSAAAALARVPGLLPNALFVSRLEQGGVSLYLVCGIVRGRPRVGFDLIVPDEPQLADVLAEFQRRFDGEFKLVGNVPELLALAEPGRKAQHVSMALDALAKEATTYAQLKRPRALTQRKRVVLLAMTAMLGAVAWKYGRAEWDAYQRRLHPPPPEKTPAERYAEDIALRAKAMAAPAGATLARWYRWYVDVVPPYVGGWVQSSVACEAVTAPVFACTVTYAIPKEAVGVTNRSFMQSLPPAFKTPVFSGGDTVVSVTTEVSGGEPVELRDLLRVAPPPAEQRTGLGSQLQVLRAVATKAELGDFTVFGTVPPEGAGALVRPYRTSKWTVIGPLRNVTELAKLPPSVALSRLDVKVDMEAEPDRKQSKFMLTVEGDAYARD